MEVSSQALCQHEAKEIHCKIHKELFCHKCILIHLQKLHKIDFLADVDLALKGLKESIQLKADQYRIARDLLAAEKINLQRKSATLKDNTELSQLYQKALERLKKEVANVKKAKDETIKTIDEMTQRVGRKEIEFERLYNFECEGLKQIEQGKITSTLKWEEGEVKGKATDLNCQPLIDEVKRVVSEASKCEKKELSMDDDFKDITSKALKLVKASIKDAIAEFDQGVSATGVKKRTKIIQGCKDEIKRLGDKIAELRLQAEALKNKHEEAKGQLGPMVANIKESSRIVAEINERKYEKCFTCQKLLCSQCSAECPTCKLKVCKEHSAECHACKKGFSSNCLKDCQGCNKKTCHGCLEKDCNVCKQKTCKVCLTECSICKKFSCSKCFTICNQCKTNVCASCMKTCGKCTKLACTKCVDASNCCDDELLSLDGATKIYGNYNNVSFYCYDLITKKLTNTNVGIPAHSRMVQLQNRIFVTGGNTVTTVSEYMEATKTLAAKASMTYARNSHAIARIAKTSFCVIGGYNSTGYIKECEEYDITTNTWKSFPSLTEGKYYIGVMLSKRSVLYCFGGCNGTAWLNTLERIDIKPAPTSWAKVGLSVNEATYGSRATMYQFSPNQILIFRGESSSDAYMLDVPGNTIKKHPTIAPIADYYNNCQYSYNGTIYTFGYNGHIHMFNPKKQEYTSMNFSTVQ